MCSLWADNYSGGSWMFRLSLPGCCPLWFLLLLSCSVVSNSSKHMECSTPGFLVLDHLPELAQTHVRWVGDVIQPPHPLSSPFPPTSVFPCIRVFFNELALPIRCPSIGASASVLPMNIQGWSPLGWTGWISLLPKGLSSLLSQQVKPTFLCSSMVLDTVYYVLNKGLKKLRELYPYLSTS